MRYFVYYRGNPQITGTAQKNNAMRIVTMFLGRACKADVLEGKRMTLVMMPDIVGDAMWMKNIVREGDIVGISERMSDMESKVDGMIARYDKERDGKDYAGTSMLKYWLEHFYLQYDEWEVEDGEE